MRGSHKDLMVWRKSMALVPTLYSLAARFPQHEKFALADQIRRAAVSVPSNIAEGKAHFTNRDFVRYLRHSRGSIAELETQLLIAESLGYVNAEEIAPVLREMEEISRMLSGLIESLASEDALIHR